MTMAAPRVFVVDDDRDHAESVADLLTLRGYDVELAFSGEEAVARFQQTEFDLILLDVKLPGMNGLETFVACQALRPDVRVVMMTGYSVEQLVRQAVDEGVLAVLHKPFDAAGLLDAVEKAQPRGLVLVADDEPEFVESLVPVLRSAGYRVHSASDGQEALHRASSTPIDCLILDACMPLLSGLEVYLRLSDSGLQIPTIMVTGLTGGEEAQRLGTLADRVLGKPFNPAALLRLLDELMPHRDRRDGIVPTALIRPGLRGHQ
ncbi:hypothetical protein SAE02_74870 [Skermanella aerolata]|uniref:Response regulatory domain-containing protein n=1 Tax=Skermanella aerolata TaxID=393310 RepID=A0A512E3P5_9PROT|nr:response regulator [Skermanella aerolata]KJB90412.1 hypothetical protein N826_41275 [Skermanella aerolata KACC 11604]GEO43339.1 hypothetical protein SAE02_74870 [Skermanella aerolata]